MARMTREEAEELARLHRIVLFADFHSLDSSMVDRIIAAADEWGYRKPKNANGSRARYFYAYMERACVDSANKAWRVCAGED